MTKSKLHKLFPLLGLAVGSAALLSACPTAQVTVTVGPTTPPPVVRPPPADCQRTHYYKLGRYRWEGGKYVFYRGGCTQRPTTWHRGCRWRPGKWVKRGRTYKFTAGGLHCGRRVIARYPTSPPPPPKAHKHLCNPRQYVQRGTWRWVSGKWRWRQGQCVVRTRNWRARRCQYRPGAWRRVGGRYVYTKGRVACALSKVPDYPMLLPPARPTVSYPKCPRRHYRVPGRYTWNRGLRRYVWRPPYCFKTPRTLRRCKLTPGRWVVRDHRATWVTGGWKCRRGPVIPHATIVKKYVPRAYPTRLPPKARRTRARCGRGPLVVHPGNYRWDPVLRRYVWQKGKCISIPRRFRSCRFSKASWRLHKDGRAHLTPAGWRCPGKALIPYSRIQPRRCTAAMRRTGRCGSVPPSLRKCKKGYHRVGGKCVRRGVRRCTKAMRKAGRCGRTVKLPKKCKRNYYLFRGKCVRRGVRRCTKAMRKAGRCR